MSPSHTSDQDQAEIVQDLVLRELSANGVLRLTLNDSRRRNALSEEMLAGLSEALEQAVQDSAVRVIVLAAVGPAFCAGHDLKQIAAGRNAEDKGNSYFTKIFASCANLMQAIVNSPKPVIAEINGVATAAGCQLVASCDLAVAAQSARFGTPGVNIGLFCSTPMVALSRNITNKLAMEMLLTGEMITADKAQRIGLVNRVVDDDHLTENTMQLAAVIAAKSSMTVATGKQAFYQQRDMSLKDAYAYTSKVMVDNLLKRDAKEGIDAFIEKRLPEWRDK